MKLVMNNGLFFFICVVALLTSVSARKDTEKFVSKIPYLSYDRMRGAYDDSRIHETKSILHLENVILAGDTLELINMEEHEKEFARVVLKGHLNGYRALASPPKLIHQLPGYRLRVLEKKPGTIIECDEYHNVTAFFTSLWHPENLFHLHANNILSIIESIQTTEGCNAQTLQCNPPSKLFLLPSDPKRDSRAVKAKLMLDKLFDLGVGRAESLSSPSDGRQCIRKIVWGRGLELMYYQLATRVGGGGENEKLPAVTLGRVTDAYHNKAVAYAHKMEPSAHILDTSSSISTSSSKSDAGNSSYTVVLLQRKDHRKLMANVVEAVTATSEELKMNMTMLKDVDFKKPFHHNLLLFLNTDIIIGPHGAGLSNSFFTRWSLMLTCSY